MCSPCPSGSHVDEAFGVWLASIAALSAAGALAATPQPHSAAKTSASFTSDQAYQGRFAYIKNCAECHGPDLGGQFGPALAGPASNVPWQTPKAVFSYMTQQMPVGNAGGLAQRDYLLIEAFILQSNGRHASRNPLTFGAIESDPTHIDGSP